MGESSLRQCSPSAERILGRFRIHARQRMVRLFLALSPEVVNPGSGLLVSGRLADLYGRKYLFLLGLSIVCIFSAISGVLRVSRGFVAAKLTSKDRIALCVVRAFAGLGSAIAMPSTFGIVGVNFTREPERTIAFAVVGLGYPIGAALGQVFGGLIADTGP